MYKYSSTKWQDRYGAFKKTFDAFVCLAIGFVVLPEIGFVVRHKKVIGWIFIATSVLMLFVVDTALKNFARSESTKKERLRRQEKDRLFQLQGEERALRIQIEQLWFDSWAKVTEAKPFKGTDGTVYVRAIVERFDDDGRQQPGSLVLIFEPVENYVHAIECVFIDGKTWSHTGGEGEDRQWQVIMLALAWVEGQLLHEHWSELAQAVPNSTDP